MPDPVRLIRALGISPRAFLAGLRGIRKYFGDRRKFRSRLSPGFAWGRELPILTEWEASSGGIGAYFHQDLRVARWIFERRPERHLDVGSRLDGFIGSLAVFREVESLDIRPQDSKIPNVVFRQIDIMEELPREWCEASDSVSSLHSIEHFGLGRYGDTIDPEGHLKGLRQLMKMVKPGGILYLSTPIGPQRIEFNAHRVFSAKTFLGWFSEAWEIVNFAVIDDSGTLHDDPSIDELGVASNFGCQLGVGIVAARKL